MRLLFVHQSFPAQYKHIARHYAEAGHEVVALRQKLGRDIPGVRSVVYDPADTGAASEDRFVRHSEAALRNAQAVLAQARALKAQGFTPDVMVGHNAWGETLFLKDVWPDTPLLSYFEYFYARPGGDSGFDPEFPEGPDSVPHGRIMNTVNLLGLQCADWGQAPTYWQRSRYPELYHPKISVIHEGIDTDVLCPKPTIKVTLPDGRILSREDEVITYVSRNLEPYRGFHVFMRTLPEILRRRPRAHVLLVGGDGVSYGPALSDGRSFKEALLQEQQKGLDLSRVHFLGQVPYEHFLAVLQVSSAHVYLTYPFVLSWSMLEAMSTGCLVIGSRTPPVEEVISDGENGLLVDFFDRKGLADRIDAVLEHPDRMQAVRDRARQTIRERYDLRSVCLPRHLRLIEDLAEGRVPEVPPQGVAQMPPRPNDEMFAPAEEVPLAAPVTEKAEAMASPATPAAQSAPTAPDGRMSIDQALALAAGAEGRGDHAQAEAILTTIVQQHPRHDGALYRLGLLRHGQGRYEEAAALLERATEVSPNVANYHCDLGFMYKQLKNLDRRLASYRRAVELEPSNNVALANLGSALNDAGEPAEAEAVCRRALDINAGNFAALVNLGSALMHQNRLDKAEKIFRRARRINPDYPEGEKNLGMCVMLKGELRRGAKYYEGRMKSQMDHLARPYKQPLWDGRKLKGRTLFLHSEQGLGDTLNFIRYASLAKARGARVVVEVQKPLVSVARTVEGVDEVVEAGQTPPRFDTWRSLMSLPFVFGHDIGTIPANIPYMKAPEAALNAWRDRLGRPGQGRVKVGLVWAGSPSHGNDRRRSITLSDLAPLFDIAGAEFYSLQKGPAAAQIQEAGFGDRLVDLGPALNDFSDTAAVLECLDLLISVDTSVVHMAGALGRPTWTLIAFHPDWRWLLEREDTPWYPTLRLLRQGEDRAWAPVIARAAQDLKALAAQPAPASS